MISGFFFSLRRPIWITLLKGFCFNKYILFFRPGNTSEVFSFNLAIFMSVLREEHNCENRLCKPSQSWFFAQWYIGGLGYMNVYVLEHQRWREMEISTADFLPFKTTAMMWSPFAVMPVSVCRMCLAYFRSEEGVIHRSYQGSASQICRELNLMDQ